MPAKINLIGQKFGKLTVIEETSKRKNKSVIWICQCECGNKEQFSTKELRSDGLIQCHQCGNHRKPQTGLTIDIIGKKFNRLTVLEKTEKRAGGKILYKCQCDCGKITYVSRTDLQTGDIKSCGCSKLKYKIGDIVNNKQIIALQGEKQKNIQNTHRHYYRCKCLLCGREYDALASTLETSQGCGCLKSIGENNIQKILDDNSISYLKEFMFKDSLYRFDFAILNNKKEVVRLIEFDGQQHFSENIRNSGWNTLEHYQQTNERDRLKNQLALKNHIPLVRIPYWYRYDITLDMLLKDNSLVIQNNLDKD